MAKSESGRRTMPQRLDPRLVGPCGFYCGYCLALKNGRCDGCIPMSEAAEREGEVFCDTYVCAKSRGFIACADCDEYPCKKYDPGESIFSELFIGWIRSDIKGKKEPR